jgi:hypothetical protein
MKTESPILPINIGDIFYHSAAGRFGHSFMKIIGESSMDNESFRVLSSIRLNEVVNYSNTGEKNIIRHSYSSSVTLLKKNYLSNLLNASKFTSYFRGVIKLTPSQIEELDINNENNLNPEDYSKILQKYPFLDATYGIPSEPMYLQESHFIGHEADVTKYYDQVKCKYLLKRFIISRYLSKEEYREIKLSKILGV